MFQYTLFIIVSSRIKLQIILCTIWPIIIFFANLVSVEITHESDQRTKVMVELHYKILKDKTISRKYAF